MLLVEVSVQVLQMTLCPSAQEKRSRRKEHCHIYYVAPTCVERTKLGSREYLAALLAREIEYTKYIGPGTRSLFGLLATCLNSQLHCHAFLSISDPVARLFSLCSHVEGKARLKQSVRGAMRCVSREKDW